ncbi:MAG: hypothetical protein EZS28_055323, partial [Streblomastix strix]
MTRAQELAYARREIAAAEALLQAHERAIDTQKNRERGWDNRFNLNTNGGASPQRLPPAPKREFEAKSVVQSRWNND